MAITSAIMAITSAKQVVIPSVTKIKKNKNKNKTLAVTIGVPSAIWLLHQPKCGNSISHCGININHYKYVYTHTHAIYGSHNENSLPSKLNFKCFMTDNRTKVL